jgi:multidrug efflux pump subunit AcrB
VRQAPGTRLEEAEKQMAAIQNTIRTVIPKHEIETMLDVMGTPYSGINLSLSEGVLISSADADVLVALKPDHKPTADYMRALRKKLADANPDTTFFFLAPDISTQVLNFGLSAPLDLRLSGPSANEQKNLEIAHQLIERLRRIPGAADVHLAQVTNVPQLRIDVDRTMAAQQGLSQRDVASDLLISLSSTAQVSPNFWVDKTRGVQYLVAVQTPQYRNNSVSAVDSTPISTGPDGRPQLLSNMAEISRTTGPVNITHYNVARTLDVQANVDGTDLGSVTSEVEKVVAEFTPKLPRGTQLHLAGQAQSMTSSFHALSVGLIFAIVLVYLLMVVNFQSWLDPLVILMALPGALSGIAWMLFLSHTRISVPALMGAIMTVGVATANSILVVTFANDQRELGRDSHSAALAAGMTRLRPVLMTALAMLLGMLPMSLGLGEGGEQNAPLGRAVIGGLALATPATLFFVPVMYSILRRRPPKPMESELEAL